jgi:phospholipid-binding lipoprotein MlaA
MAVCLALSLAGCAGAPGSSPPSYLAKGDDGGDQAQPKETPDPFESLNRKVFEGNQRFNTAVVYPMAKAYREGVPEKVRDRVDAFTTNLTEPMVFANNVLQLRFDAATTTLARFITNTTVGLGGLFDVAATVGQNHQSGDFGQTLYVWGIHDTAYLVLPVLGPSNVRDGIGTGISLVAPMGVVSMVPTRLATATSQVNVVDAVGMPVAGLGKVDQLQELEAGSLDFYAMLRSVTDQKRQHELQEARNQSLFYGLPSAPAGEAAQAPAATGQFEPTIIVERGGTLAETASGQGVQRAAAPSAPAALGAGPGR